MRSDIEILHLMSKHTWWGTFHELLILSAQSEQLFFHLFSFLSQSFCLLKKVLLIWSKSFFLFFNIFNFIMGAFTPWWIFDKIDSFSSFSYKSYEHWVNLLLKLRHLDKASRNSGLISTTKSLLRSSFSFLYAIASLIMPWIPY